MKKLIASAFIALLVITYATAQDVTFTGANCNGALVSGTWTVPCNVTAITVEVRGAGGGGGGGGGGSNGGLFNTRGGGGGGGGGYTTRTFNVTPGTTFNYTAGTGGCGGSNGGDGSGGGNGTNGGNSTFTGTDAGGNPISLTANGGSRGTGGSGTQGSTGSGGGGGTASGGTTNTTGTGGSNGSGGTGGSGGGGAGPGGGNGGVGSGAIGTAFGGGGAGGGDSPGGRGGAGGVLITYTTTVPLPVTPTITSTAATCTAPGTSTISNYDNTTTYTFTPAGPTVAAGGAINGMVTGTSYTVTAGTGNCASTPSAPFSNAAPLPTPTATITGNLSYCTGGNTTLTASGGIAYTWADAGGNIIGNSASVTVTQGMYGVLVTDANGCGDTALVMITEVAAQPVNITGNLTYCAGSNTTLTANGSVSYLWNDASNSTTAAVTVTQGSYTVTGTDANGCTATASATVTENASPTATITGQLQYCTGSNTTLTANGGTSYVWSNGSTTAAITVTQGNYIVTATDANNCTGSANATVTEISTLPVNITGSLDYCPGGNTTITANGGIGYLWNDANNSTTAAITVTQGSYTVTGTDANGCTGTATANVTELTSPTISITGNLSYCVGANTTLTANGGTAYVWNDANNSTTAAVTVTQGSYTVTGTDANGCTATANATVTESAAPTVAITGNLTYCTGGNTTLTATGGTGYVWSNGSTTANVTVTQGTYTVTATDANTCTGSATAAVTESSTLVVSITGTLSHCPGGNTTLTATGGTSYVWSNGNTTDNITATQGTYTVTATDASCTGTASANVAQLTTQPLNLSNVTACQDSAVSVDAGSGFTAYTWSSGETTQTITPTAAGNYTVTVVDANGCDVTGTASVTFNECIEVEDFTVFIPNAFTPNGDGNNDRFQCYIDGVVYAEVKVFNRWGEKVFETNNVYDYWDGSHIGEQCKPGVYVYHVMVVGLNGKSAKYKGAVTLIK